jgi:menaquinone-dependent protoporphyrinogen oxidase
MKVLVVYASRYGATQGIAETVGAVLRQQGLETDILPVSGAPQPAGYDAVVIGSASYFFQWMKPAVQYVRGNQAVLARIPVWLFSSGPLGTNRLDGQGRDLLQVTEPKQIAEFRGSIHPRTHQGFFGAMDHSKLGCLHRLMRKLPVNRDDALFPEGDFRDWDQIKGWASGIAAALQVS